jgi:hypothetical protein
MHKRLMHVIDAEGKLIGYGRGSISHKKNPKFSEDGGVLDEKGPDRSPEIKTWHCGHLSTYGLRSIAEFLYTSLSQLSKAFPSSYYRLHALPGYALLLACA